MSRPPRRATDSEGRSRIRAGRSRPGAAPDGGVARALSASKSPREGAAVDEDILARDEAGVGAGEEGAQRAELGRIAESPDRNSGLRIGSRRVDADAPLRRGACEAGFLSVGFKRSRLDRVDRDIVARE